MQLLDGLATAALVRQSIAREVQSMVASGKRPPHLAAVLVGDDPASRSYVTGKIKACEEVGFLSSLIAFPSTISEQTILETIDDLNQRSDVDGFIVQLPLPQHIDATKVLLRLNPEKDVDGFHPVNVGKMCLGLDGFLPATPNGILRLLEQYHIETTGKHCVVVGRSAIVGLPMSILMQRQHYPGNATVTIAHSKTQSLRDITRQADILIVAVGRPGTITGDMVKDGAVVIDVGVSRVEDATKKSGFRLTGDVVFEEVAPKSSYITPVPGGVGPMTIASLLLNTLQAALNHQKSSA
jgi:methylenetetrahydrofolate dehydrogenase (NADP+) / methenyltetrahydrofolate cyclohydrolase